MRLSIMRRNNGWMEYGTPKCVLFWLFWLLWPHVIFGPLLGPNLANNKWDFTAGKNGNESGKVQ